MRVKWTGIRPLLMSNPQTVQLSNPFSVESRRLTTAMKAARKKQDENKLVELEQEQMRNDWEASAYYDADKALFFLPDTVIAACIKAGASVGKKGRDVDRAVIVNEDMVYVEDVPKHKSLDEYYKDAGFQFESPAKVPPKTGALIWKKRCMMPTGWSVTFSLDYDEGMFAQKSLEEAMENAGKLAGVGGWRPKFGRFTVTIL